MRAAGQMVVASAGNSGSLCSSVDDPISLYDAVFSVGAHGETGAIAPFSSRGPVIIDGSGRLKPDLSAPGVGVRSAYVNHGYGTLSGTSMASPHVAGAVALLWSAVPTLTSQITLTEQILIKSATPVPFNQCGEATAPITPNNTYGYGRLDVLAAVQMAQNPGVVDVQVLDSGGAPVSAVEVRVRDQLTGYQYVLQTDATGNARAPVVYAGAYTVQVPNNLSLGQSTVSLQAGQQQTVVLQQQPLLYFFPFVANQ
jgi:subtilisin family serine protease